MKHLLFPLMLMVVILIPLTALAADTSGSLLSMACYDSSGGCSVCDIVSLINIIVRLILSLAGIASLIMFIWAGLEMVMSAGSSEKIKSARTKIIGSLTGILIIYFAWVGVNFIIKSFTDTNQASVFSFGAWNKLECVSEPATYLQQVEQNVAGATGCKSSWESGSAPLCSNGNCAGFATTSINSEQCKDASPALNSYLVCLSNKLTTAPEIYAPLVKSNIVITSVSDDDGLYRCRTSYDNSKCDHLPNSCHYGHGNKDGSYAVDIRSTTMSDEKSKKLKQLISDCKGDYVDETDTDSPHHHTSAPECAGR